VAMQITTIQNLAILDVHILINKKDIAECEAEIIDDFLRDKKALWSLKHDVKVYGFPVELYAQDIDEKTSPNQGVFSLLNNKWLKKPVFEKVNLQDPSFYKNSKKLHAPNR